MSVPVEGAIFLMYVKTSKQYTEVGNHSIGIVCEGTHVKLYYKCVNLICFP